MMEETHTDRPEFTIALRGYDRLQVDEYVDRLHGLVTDAEERARAAESELEFSRHTNVGPRVTEILELAVAEAKELREKTSTECEKSRATAGQDAKRIVEGARAEASEIVEKAERERDEVLARLEAEQRQAHFELERLAESKQQLVAHLRRLHQAVGAAADLGGATAQMGEEDDDQAASTTEEVTDNRESQTEELPPGTTQAA
jgi:cell division septum initiation protein DivIVA